MEQIFINAYADGIVQSLKARYSKGDADVFAAVDLGEERYSDTIYMVLVKFYWEHYRPVIGTIEGRLEAVLQLDILSSRVRVGSRDNWSEWHALDFAHVDSSTDWITQEALRAV